MTLAGLLLRGIAARGGLWLDEAWSAVFAQEVATPAGVLFAINHDNNHHLNTLWLQLVGPDAPPMLQRALSIVCGTATIPVAASVAERRGPAPAILAAIAFCLAPFLLTYGSEARGYAPMLFAWVCAIAIADRWLGDTTARKPATALAIAAMVGCLAQATMLFGLTILALWVAVDRVRRSGWRRGLIDTATLFAPAATVAVLLVALGWWAATIGGGFHIGNREPHDWAKWLAAMGQLVDGMLGPAVVPLLLVPVLWWVRDRLAMLAMIACALPLLFAVLAMPNSGAARYYAVIVPPVLLFVAIALPLAWQWPRGRLVAGAMAVVFLTNAAVQNSALIRNRRGDPGQAVATLARIAPRGTAVSLDYARSSAILIAAARSQHYPLSLAEAPCPPARFHFVERDGNAPFPAAPGWCGRAYREVTRGDPAGLSGTHWRLYAALR